MLPDNRSGFYVTAKDCDGNVRVIRHYETLEDLVRGENYRKTEYIDNRQYFSEDHNVRVPYHWDKYFLLHYKLWTDDEEATSYAYVVIDHNENVVPICELNRVEHELFATPRVSRWRRRYGGRRPVWGGWKKPHSTQEKRQYYATIQQAEEEGVDIKIRGRRKPCNLPDAWDDWDCHNDRCWKTQSKRRHQWKAK
jgi:hypothetical protein